MSTLDLSIVVLGVLVALTIIAEHVPAVVRARADADLARQGARFSGYDVELAVAEAIRRTDPDVGDELAGRLAQTTIEDLLAGHLYPSAEDVDAG